MKRKTRSEDDGIFRIQVCLDPRIGSVVVVFYRVDQIFLVELTKAFVDYRFSIRDLSERIGCIVEEIATGNIDFFAPLIRIV